MNLNTSKKHQNGKGYAKHDSDKKHRAHPKQHGAKEGSYGRKVNKKKVKFGFVSPTKHHQKEQKSKHGKKYSKTKHSKTRFAHTNKEREVSQKT